MTHKQLMLFVHSSDELYGADRMLLQMIHAIGSDFDVLVLLPDDLEHSPAPLCQELERRNIRVRHVSLPIFRRALRHPRGIAGLVKRTLRLRNELRALRPTAVYCTTSATLLAGPVARLAGVPQVLGHMQEIWSRSDRWILCGPALACHRLLSISHAVTAALPHRLLQRTIIVANGTPEPSNVTPLEEHSGPLRFVVASRWNRWKGHRTLLRAWERANSPGHLVILGGPPPSGGSVDVISLVAMLEHPNTVTVLGEVDDPSGQIEAADVVLMPSDQPEPFGLVAIEAFARGRPVIASAAGGLLDIVEEGRNGWFFAPGDAGSLASIFRNLTRKEVCDAGKLARQSYQEHFTADRFADNWRRAISLLPV